VAADVSSGSPRIGAMLVNISGDDAHGSAQQQHTGPMAKQTPPAQADHQARQELFCRCILVLAMTQPITRLHGLQDKPGLLYSSAGAWQQTNIAGTQSLAFCKRLACIHSLTCSWASAYSF